MADDSIVGMLGAISTASVGFVAANEIYKNIQEAKNIAEEIKSRKTVNKYSVKRNLVNNLKDMGFANMNHSPAFELFSLEQLKETKGITSEYHSAMVEFVNKLSHKNVRLGARSYNGKATELAIDMGGGYKSLGPISYNGVMLNASSGKPRASFTHRFFVNNEATHSIVDGSFNKGPNFLSDNLIDFNSAKMSVLNSRILPSDSAGTIAKKIQAANIGFNDYVLRDPSVSKFKKQNHMNTMAPIYIDEHGLHKMSPYDDVTRSYVNNMRSVASSSSGSTPITFGQDASQIGRGLFTNPNVNTKSYKALTDLLGRSEPGTHPLMQMLNRPARFEGSNKFHDSRLETMRKSGVNIEPVTTVHVGEDARPVLEALLAQGVGNNGAAVPMIGDEGLIAGKRYLNRKQNLEMTNMLDLSKDGYITPDMEKLLNYIVTENVGSDKATTILGSNRTRSQYIQGMIEDGSIKKLLKKKRIDLSTFFGHSNPILFRSQSGDFAVGKYGRTILKDIALEGSSLRFDSQLKYLREDAGGKEWGTLKVVATRGITQEKTLSQSLIAIDDYARGIASKTGNPESYRNIMKSVANRIKSGKNVDYIYDVYGDSINAFNADVVSTQDVRTPPTFAEDSSNSIADITRAETIARANNHPDIPFSRILKRSVKKDVIGDRGIRTMVDVASGDAPHSLYGYDLNHPVSVNATVANRLRGAGLEPVAKYIEQSFNTGVHHELLDDFDPLYNRTTKHHMGIPLNQIDDTSLSNLFGADGKIAKQTALDLLGKESVPDGTKFFVNVDKDVYGLNQSRNIPVSLTDSPYTLGLNKYHFDQEETSIKKSLTSKLYAYAKAQKDERSSAAKIAWDDLNNTAASVLYDPGKFANVMHKDARIAMVSDGYMLNDNYLNSLVKRGVISDEHLTNTLNKFDLKRGKLSSQPVHGVSRDRFTGIMNALGFKDRAAAQKNAWQVVGRDPANTFEGFSVGRAIDMNYLANELVSGMSDGNQKKYRKSFNKNIHDSYVYVNKRGMQKAALDLDNDPFKMIPIADANIRSQIPELLKKQNNFLDAIYGGKGNLKGSGKVRSARDIIELALTEKSSIAPVYRKAQRYSGPIIDIASAVGDEGALSSSQKALALNQFSISLSEGAIGAKNMQTEDAVGELLNLLDRHNSDIDGRIESFRNLVGQDGQDWRFTKDVTDSDGKVLLKKDTPIFSKVNFTNEDIGSWLKAGDSADQTIVDLASKGIRDRAKVMDVLNKRRARGFGGFSSADAAVREFNVASDTASTTSKVVSTASDISENVLPKLLKNKTLQAIVGASVVAGLVLSSSGDHIDAQEVREESRPKGKIPIGAKAIDPKVGMLSQERLNGYKLSVRGTVPSGKSISRVRADLASMGMSPRNTYINNNDSINRESVKSLQDDDKYNKWNLG